MALSWVDGRTAGELEHQSEVPIGIAPAGIGAARVFSLPGQVLETNHPGNIVGLEEFLEAVVALSGAQGGVIRALTHDGGYMRLMAACGLSDEFLQRELLIGVCGVCGMAARDDDIHTASDFRGCSQLFSAKQSGSSCFRHIVAVPLDYKGEPVGVFNLFYDRPEDCRPSIKTLLRPIGQLLGLTLENSILERERARVAVNSERQAMAADIHDALAQTLAFGRMRVPLVEDAVKAGDSDKALQYCEELNGELTQAHRGLRQLITQFRAGLDSAGLRRGLREMAARFRESSGIALEFDNQVPDLRLNGEAEVEVFFIVQEALANVRKHAKASRTRLAVDHVSGGLEIMVEDNGSGQWSGQLSGQQSRGASHGAGSHFGLRIMRERAQRFGGRLDIEGMPKGGTRVRVFIPESEIQGSSTA